MPLFTFCGRLGCDCAGRGGKERAWFPSCKARESDAADPSAVLPRWGKTSVPAKAQTRQDPQNLLILFSLTHPHPQFFHLRNPEDKTENNIRDKAGDEREAKIKKFI